MNVDPHAAPTTVIATIEGALRGEPIPGVDSEPAPDCVLVDFGDSWARYAVRYWLTDILRTDRTDSAVRTRLWFALKREGVVLSIPAHSVLLTSEDEEHRQRLRADDMARKRTALTRVSILSPLTEEERLDLAGHLLHAPFAAGELILVQGTAVHHLYILTKGEAEVNVSVEGGPSRTRSPTSWRRGTWSWPRCARDSRRRRSACASRTSTVPHSRRSVRFSGSNDDSERSLAFIIRT